MTELSKVKLNGTTYDIKDAVARAGLVSPEPDENVTQMLLDFGLNATTELEKATAGTSKAGSAVVSE